MEMKLTLSLLLAFCFCTVNGQIVKDDKGNPVRFDRGIDPPGTYDGDSLTTSRFIGDSIMIEYRYVDSETKSTSVFHVDSAGTHEHNIATIYIYKYRGNRKQLIGSCKGIYSPTECASDSAVRWYRKVKGGIK